MNYRIADDSQTNELVKMRLAYLHEDFNNLDEITESKISQSLPDYFRKHLNKDLFGYVAETGENKEIAACAFLLVVEKPANPNFITGKIGTVINVYTRPEYRRKGIASQVMKMLLEDARKKDLDFVELKATEDGYGLYQSLGFKDSVSKYREMEYRYTKTVTNIDHKEIH